MGTKRGRTSRALPASQGSTDRHLQAPAEPSVPLRRSTFGWLRALRIRLQKARSGALPWDSPFKHGSTGSKAEMSCRNTDASVAGCLSPAWTTCAIRPTRARDKLHKLTSSLRERGPRAARRAGPAGLLSHRRRPSRAQD